MSQDLEPKTIDQATNYKPDDESTPSSEYKFSRRVGLGGAIAVLSLAACGQTPEQTTTVTPEKSVATPEKKKMLEQWLPSQGDFLNADKLQTMTPEQLAVAGQIKTESVKTIEDLGREFGYRLNAMTGAGRTLEDIKPFRAADGQIGVDRGEAYIQAMQIKYLLPLADSIRLWNASDRSHFTTTGLAQASRFELFNYHMNRGGEAVNGQAEADVKSSMTFIEGTFTEGDLNSPTAKANLKFRKQANNSETPVGKIDGQKDTDQYETYNMIISKSGDHILAQFGPYDAAVQPINI